MDLEVRTLPLIDPLFQLRRMLFLGPGRVTLPNPKIEPPPDLDGLGWLVLNPTMAKTDGVEDAQL